MTASQYRPWSDYWRTRKSGFLPIELATLLENIRSFAGNTLAGRELAWDGMETATPDESKVLVSGGRRGDISEVIQVNTVRLSANLVSGQAAPLPGDVYDASIGQALHTIAEVEWGLNSDWPLPVTQEYLHKVLDMFRTMRLAATGGGQYSEQSIRSRYVGVYLRNLGQQIDWTSLWGRLRECPNARDAVSALGALQYGEFPPGDLPEPIAGFLTAAASKLPQIHGKSPMMMTAIANELWHDWLSQLPDEYTPPAPPVSPENGGKGEGASKEGEDDGDVEVGSKGSDSGDGDDAVGDSGGGDNDGDTDSGARDETPGDDAPGNDGDCDRGNGESDDSDTDDDGDSHLGGDTGSEDDGEEEDTIEDDSTENSKGDDWDASGDDVDDPESAVGMLGGQEGPTSSEAPAEIGKQGIEQDGSVLPDALLSNSGEPELPADIAKQVTDALTQRAIDATADVNAVLGKNDFRTIVRDAPTDEIYVSRLMASVAQYEEPIRQALTIQRQRLMEMDHGVSHGRLDGGFIHRLVVGDNRAFKYRQQPKPPTVDLALLIDWSGSMIAQYDTANEVATALYRACRGFPNLDTWIYAYTTAVDDQYQHSILVSRILTPFTDRPMMPEKPQLGFTPSGHALLAIGSELQERGQRDIKAIIHITDGQPRQYAIDLAVTAHWAKEAVQHLQAQRFRLYCLGIETEAGDNADAMADIYGENFQVIQTVSEVPEAVKDIVNAIFTER